MMEDGLPPNGNGNGHPPDGFDGRLSSLEWGYRELKGDVDKLDRAISAGFDKVLVQVSANRDRNETEISAVRTIIAEKDKRDYERTKPNYLGIASLILGGITVTAGFTGTAYFLTSQQTQVLVQPIMTSMAQVQNAFVNAERRIEKIEDAGRDIDRSLQLNDARDSRSEQDRADSRQRLDHLQEQVGELSNVVTADKSALAEIETQFRADELVASQRESNTEQWKGMFFQKLYGVALPQRGPVVPGIARTPRDGG